MEKNEIITRLRAKNVTTEVEARDELLKIADLFSAEGRQHEMRNLIGFDVQSAVREINAANVVISEITPQTVAKQIAASGALGGGRFAISKLGRKGWQGISHSDAVAAVKGGIDKLITTAEKEGRTVDANNLKRLPRATVDIEVRKILTLEV